ncbi:MAG: HNH endonuclease [Endozoicomonadaceae bacterium]|nr:HNH endonuclease [Endozoicomonadaceae bacterium]
MILTIDETQKHGVKQFGEMAHIVAKSPDGPRGDAYFPKENLNKYGNLILLCRNHHRRVDECYKDYPVEKLHKMKKKHEKWVNESLQKAVPDITFAELKASAKAILSAPVTSECLSFDVLELDKKIEKNNLTKSTRSLITMGLSVSETTRAYIESQEKLDNNYPEQLKKGFKNEYNKLVEKGLSGDALFESMLEFSTSGHDFKDKAAGLAILVHLFELCEIFEK